MNSRQIGISGKSMDTQLRTHRPAWLTLAALSPDLVGGDGEVEGAGRLPPLQRQLQPHRVDPGLGAPLPTQARVCDRDVNCGTPGRNSWWCWLEHSFQWAGICWGTHYVSAHDCDHVHDHDPHYGHHHVHHVHRHDDHRHRVGTPPPPYWWSPLWASEQETETGEIRPRHRLWSHLHNGYFLGGKIFD